MLNAYRIITYKTLAKFRRTATLRFMLKSGDSSSATLRQFADEDVEKAFDTDRFCNGKKHGDESCQHLVITSDSTKIFD